MIEISKLIDPVSDDDIEWVSGLMKLHGLDESRRSFLKSLSTLDVSACPGSGKTTLVVAKLAILARKWKSHTRGICVLSHTNVAREEIEHRLGNTDVGRRLLGYPHFIGTIHAFVNRFLATPWLLSARYPVTAIDNDLTTRVRRRFLGESNYRKLNGYLENKYSTFGALRLSTSNFSAPIAEGAFPCGPHTTMYKLAASALRHAAEQGYFCYDEIFLLGEALLSKQAILPLVLQHRFPLVLIDEMQDTSEEQNNFLRRIFPRGLDTICVQRVGDPNQAIYEGGNRPVTDAFPEAARCVDIADSFRFDASIAALANRFAYRAVPPAGLTGRRATDVPAKGAPHTIFVFPDNDASKVLDAFGRHALGSLAPELIGTSTITAIGAVHRSFDGIGQDHKHYPKTVAHYWAGYQSAASRPSFRPRTLAHCILSAQSLAACGGAIHQCVNSVAIGIVDLANRMAGTARLKTQSRPHLQVEQQLSGRPEALAIYRSLLDRFLFEQEVLTRSSWSLLCPRLKTLAATLGGGDANSVTANELLEWHGATHMSMAPVKDVIPATAANTYRFHDGMDSVDIRLSSIHAAKGQTHLATLILESYDYGHFLHSLLPWLLGKNENGKKCSSDKATQRLMQIYVAMTRPTHLLCLAIRNGSLGSGEAYSSNQEKLIERGWRIEHLGPSKS